MRLFSRALASAACFSLLFQPLPSLAFQPLQQRIKPLHHGMNYRPSNMLIEQRFTLLDGRTVKIEPNGVAAIYDKRGKIADTRWVAADQVPNRALGPQAYHEQLVNLSRRFLQRLPKLPYANDHVIVVFRDGISAASDHVAIAKTAVTTLNQATTTQATAAAPHYTNDYNVNRTFASLGVSNVDRLFSAINSSQLSSMRTTASARTGRQLLNVADAYSVRITKGNVQTAVTLLRAVASVAYVSPDWIVTPMAPPGRVMPDIERRELRGANIAALREASRLRSETGTTQQTYSNALPANYSTTSSLQSLLDSSGVDAMSAYEEIIEQFHQLPGTGETITNVSVGDIFTAQDVPTNSLGSPNDICAEEYAGFGPTAHTIGGQRYLDWPGLPLIPAYAADANGHVDPHYYACGEGDLGEIGLDFSMMAPLPDDRQRAGERASQGIGDLVGIAPGANYRLFVPATNVSGGINSNFLSAIDGVFLAAAAQNPKPDVITASLGEGFDAYGFPGRFLEDDPLTASIIATLVNGDNIVVCISAGDGMRTFTPTAIGPSGGSAATNVTTNPNAITNLNDLEFSTAPSLDLDSGALDVGGVTLNDVYAAPPLDPTNAQFANTLAFPETRYDGGQYLSSGFGQRVNISAPSDNVVALNEIGGGYDQVDAVSEGGTSASAPEVAAAAAVVMQVAKLTGHPFSSAAAVRSFLIQTATPVVQPEQTDQILNVGPEVNVRQAVEKLMGNAGMHPAAKVLRVGIAQRRVIMPLTNLNTLYFTDTDPSLINLSGEDYGNGDGPDGSGLYDWITIAPDWQGLPANASFRLYVQGHPEKVLATSRFARLLPSQILTAAGLPPASNANRTVHLTYRAAVGLHKAAQAGFDLTFGPSTAQTVFGPAPFVPAVDNADTTSSFKVKYDISAVRNFPDPVLVVTEPGRFTPSSPYILHFSYAQALSTLTGTVSVPLAALQGGGLYGVGIMSTDPSTQAQRLTDFAVIRVQQGSTSRAPAPLLSVVGDPSAAQAHFVQVPYGGSVKISWDVSSVPKATGALLEVSAPGPTLASLLNTFNNPNGTVPDNNGLDTGSVKTIQLPGISGGATFTATNLGLSDTMLHTLRVIPINGPNAAGEAGDLSMIVYNGLTGLLGGYLDDTASFYQGGFGINTNGTDGFFLENLPYGSGYMNSLETFDQTTGAVHALTSAYYAGGIGTLGGGYYATDQALLGVLQSTQSQFGEVYGTLSPLLNAPSGSVDSFALPTTTLAIEQSSYNPASSLVPALVYDATLPNAQDTPSLAVLNLATKTLGSQFPAPVTYAFPGAIPLALFGADMGLNKAVYVRMPSSDWTGGTPAYIDLQDLSSGQVSEQQLQQARGIAMAMATDESTHMLITDSVADNSLDVINLQTLAEHKVALPYTSQLSQLENGSGGLSVYTPQFIAADPVNHLFLVYSAAGERVLNYDFNSTAELYVIDENGNLIETLTGFQGSLPATTNAFSYLQVNGNTRTAFLMDGSEIATIKY